MSIFTQMNPTIMRDKLEDTMLSYAEIQSYVPIRDDFGQITPAFVTVAECQCGFKRLRISEQPSFTGVAKHLDGIVRLPLTVLADIEPQSRILISEGGEGNPIAAYNIVGELHVTDYHIICEVARVQL